MRRTTMDLDDDLYRRIKRAAVDRGRPMRRLVEEALRAYLKVPLRSGQVPEPKFGVYRARVRGSLSRREIYDEHLAKKIA